MGKDTGHVGTGTAVRKLQERIAGLEEDLSDLRAVVGGMAVEVVTQRVRVVDDQDRDRVRLDSDGHAFAVTGPDGVERVSLRSVDAGISMLFLTTEDDTYLSLHAGEENGRARVAVTAVLDDRRGREASLGCESGRVAPGVTEEIWGGPLPPDGEPEVWLRA